MKVRTKKVMKVAGAACAATGIVAISALVASGAAIEAVVEGFKSARNTAKKVLSDGSENEIVVDEQQREDNVIEVDAEEEEHVSEETITDELL